ncbi:succinyl-diaminopimelate desuccinylase [Rubrobacter indicoceani]|uniref:succinyl-diaminopimelate desuccinylase n=1 Tax=Rubrobacter indicoceani TaxID=2051957 RepID=UPI000E5AEEF3|nr:succinyl-diaminopimelate desuccinylase [Rubrobacter indicoceani]
MTGGEPEDRRLVDNLLWLLARKSPIGFEKALCDDLEARLASVPGFKTVRVANNLAVRRTEPDGSRPKIVFAGHLDTVPEPKVELPVRVEAGKVYGRGSTDMKAGDAVMLSLLEDFNWSGSWAEPLFVFYEREEGPHLENGLETVFPEVPWVLEADLAIVPEPTEGTVEAGCVGTAQVEVTFNGRAAHSARPWLGLNAVTLAGDFLAKLHALEPEEVDVDGLVFREVLTVTLARGGVAANVVPDTFWINVNMRFAPGRDRKHVEATFRGLLADLPDGTAEFAVVDFAPSGDVDLSHPLLERLIQTGLEVRPKQAWTDVARFAASGVPAVNLGPGTPAQAHQDAEYAEVALLVECYGKLAGYLAKRP